MSKPKLTADANTKALQQIASSPQHSAWVSANAGSGKTTVLSRRVVRLLLKGTEPASILCLTFTKAAAGEMSNRVFEILGTWATLPEDELKQDLTEIEGRAPTREKLTLARTLFARALETPGGLKIQTIHAFCEAILHQFPLEANVPGNFTVMDDSTQAQLVADARRTVILDADAAPNSEIGEAFKAIMDVASDHAIEKVFDEIIGKRDRLADWIALTGGPESYVRNAKKQLGFSDNETGDALAEQALNTAPFSDAELDYMASFGRPLPPGKAFDKLLAERIDVYLSADGSQAKLKARAKIFLTSGAPRKLSNFATKPVKEAFPQLEEQIASEAEIIRSTLLRINTLHLIHQTKPLMVIAQGIINHYRTAKRQLALLDFDDLVSRTADLLTRKSARAWVLYKLDLGVDHILLDEAQDTNPSQWRIISALAEEFFNGESARQTDRTVFAVGDEKQSIYSFQGAEPAQFVSQRRAYTKASEAAGKDMPNVNLGVSFRSTQDVLSAVDAVFDHPDNQDGISFGDDRTSHTAARTNDPGSVEVWPLVKPDQADDADDWSTPQDQSKSRHQAVLLANRIADTIKTWLGGERMEASGKRIEAGDVLVLVRARDRFMTALNRALKDRGVPVAGTDRLALTNHIAVKDLMALGQVMLTPDDDLSLACVLKSPLIGLTEDQLYQLARARLHDKYEVSLFDALKEAAEHSGENAATPFSTAYEKLIAWRNRADALPVYEFYARILGTDHGRLNFFSRLGAEAEDVLDAFLDRTLTHERGGLPGLQAFIESLANDAPEIKREMDQTAGQVRVMTVHAAKGLEAPIVFLIDKSSPAFMGHHAPALYDLGTDDNEERGFLWVPKAEQHGHATLQFKEEVKRKAEQEYRRLLYVAMTRAKDRLIICGYKSASKNPQKPNWHGMVEAALSPTWQEMTSFDGTTYHRWKAPGKTPEQFHEPEHHADEAVESPVALSELPGWVGHNLKDETALPRPLNPSGAQALIDESLAREVFIPSLVNTDVDGEAHTAAQAGDDSARLRGTALHKLLQVLPDQPEEKRWLLAQTYLQKMLPSFSDIKINQLLYGLRATFHSPTLAPFFDPTTSRAEVPVVGRLDLASGPRPVSGTIDRLAVLEDHVMLLDYKTTAYQPKTLDDVSPDYITQMALYRALVRKIYPDRPIRAALVWTHARPSPSGEVPMTLIPEEVMDKAYNAIAGL